MDLNPHKNRYKARPMNQSTETKMRKYNKKLIAQMLMTATALAASVSVSHARSSYGPSVDSACMAFNGTQPYASLAAQNTDACTLCHAPSPGSKATRVDPQWTWWQNQSTQITNFCPPQTNQAPDGAINTPANNIIANVGSSVAFAGTGSDPDGNLPLTYLWNFGGGASNSTLQNPVAVLNTVGTFTVTFTVTDSLGRADPTPAAITITVIDPNANQAPNGTIVTPAGNVSINVGESVAFSGTGTDPDNNTPLAYQWNFGGGAANSSQQNPSATFNNSGIYTVTFTVTDNKGLSDPTPAARTVSVGLSGTACTDQDNDLFSPDGGVCGPIDCNDFDAAVNPGALEACSDHVDNDCNGDIDGNDAHCNGADCIGDLLKQIEIVSASWDREDSELKVKGTWTTPGASVKLSDALTGTVLGTTTVRSNDEHHDHEDDEHENSTSGIYTWEFELEHLAAVPCRIRAEINGRYGERDVAYAPANCSGKPPVTNNPPVANDDSVSTAQRVPVTIAVLANDTDVDGDRLTIVVFTQPEHGTVTKNGDRLIYTPSRRFTGRDEFTYTLSDGHGGTDTATVFVNVQRSGEHDD